MDLKHKKIILGKKIKALRAFKGKTQEEFAKELGVRQKAVSEWENGKSLIALRCLFKIQDVYGVRLQFFDVLNNSDLHPVNWICK